MTTNSLNLKVLRVEGNDTIFAINNPFKIIAFIDKHICPYATRIPQKEADEILNLLDIDDTLAFIHFNQLWERYHEIKNLC